MNLKLIVLIEIFSLLSVTMVVNMIKKEKLDLKYALLWIFLTIIVSIFGLFPNLIVILSNIIGIYIPINAMFFIGFVFVLLIVFSIMVQISRISTRQKQLVQYMAIFDYKNSRKNIYK